MVGLFFQWGGKVWQWNLFNRSHSHCLAAASSNQNLLFSSSGLPVRETTLWNTNRLFWESGGQPFSISLLLALQLGSNLFLQPSVFSFQVHSKVTYGSKSYYWYSILYTKYVGSHIPSVNQGTDRKNTYLVGFNGTLKRTVLRGEGNARGTHKPCRGLQTWHLGHSWARRDSRR